MRSSKLTQVSTSIIQAAAGLLLLIASLSAGWSVAAAGLRSRPAIRPAAPQPSLTAKAPGLTAKAPRSDGILLLVSGEDDGYLEPCGCSSPQTGGLPRRGSILANHPDALAVDNGDWIVDPGRQAELKAQTTVRFLAQYHYAACNLGEHDYALGFPLLTMFRQSSPAPLLSTNVLGPGGSPIFARSVVVRRQGLRIAFFGELSPSFSDAITPANPRLTVADPVTSLEQAHREAPAELAVLLYHGPATEAQDIARRCPWLSLIITAHDGDDPRSDRPQPDLAPVMSVGARARFFGRALLHVPAPVSQPAGQRATNLAPIAMVLPALSLGPAIPDAKPVQKLLRDYQDQVVAEDLLSQVPRAPLQGNWYAGSKACAACHAAAYRVWAHSKHPHAYGELIRVGHSRDPECVGCHVVGLNSVGGFTSLEKTPQFAGVGCETCHGPQGLHTRGKGPRPDHLDKAMCVSCHNPEQSVHFNLAAYWPPIAH